MEGVSDTSNLAVVQSFAPLLSGLWRNPTLWALLIAVLTPVAIIVGRQGIRMRRVRQIFDFERRFERIGRRGGDRKVNPSFEFVRSKYIENVDLERLNDSDHLIPSGEQYEALLKRIARQGRRNDFRLLPVSIALMMVIFFGVSALMAAVTCGFQGVGCSCSGVMFASCADQASSGANALGAYGKFIVVGGLAFAGAYVQTLRSFLRSLAVFDLSSYTFLRQTGEMIAAIVFTIIAYAAISDPFHPFNAPPDDQHVSRIWLAIAPILGLVPHAATQFLLTKTRNLVPWFKTEDDSFENVTTVTTVDAIDGIDFVTRFRLEECGVYDVQNVATANPIMLHIETPYGIYQCIDWVAQAQLCHILGIEKFLMMRELNIRTIFDLERAIDSRDDPDEIDTIYAGILFAPTQNLRRVSIIGDSKPMIVDGGAVTPVTVDKYCEWARKIVGVEPLQATKCIEHVMRWIGDDLHVRRLRLIWNDISASLGSDAETLTDSKTRRSDASCENRDTLRTADRNGTPPLRAYALPSSPTLPARSAFR